MEFTISKSKLTTCLGMVKTAIPPKTTNPILKTVMLRVVDNKAIFRGTNTILDISVTIPIDVKSEGECCFDSVVLDIIQNFSDDDIKFKLKDNKLTVSQGKRRHNPLFSDTTEYPQKHECDNYIQYNPTEFLMALSRTSICTSTLVDRPVLQGFYINPHENFIVTGDGDRVSLWENISLPGNITIPHSRIVMSILPYVANLGENGQFELSLGQWTGFKGTIIHDNENVMSWEIIFNSLAGDFPEVARKAVKDALSTPPKFKVISNKTSIRNILEICKVYSDRAYAEGRPNQVVLSSNGQGVKFSMNIPDLIEMEEHLEAETEGEEFSIWFDPRMLLEAISQVQADDVELRFFGSKVPFVLLDNQAPQFAYLQVSMVPTTKE